MTRPLLTILALLLCLADASAGRAEELSRPIPLWPVLYHRSDDRAAETDVLWPFFHYERRDTFSRYDLRPLVSTESDPARDFRKTSFILSLSTYERKGPRTWFHLFPVYWYEREPGYRHTVVFPVYWDIERGADTTFHIWPLFGISRRGNTFAEYSTLYPLFRYSRDTAAGEVSAGYPWPLAAYHRRNGSLEHWFFPLYWRREAGDASEGFTTLYYWKTAPGVSRRGIFPVWHSSRTGMERADLVLPFYFNRETADSRLRFITPFAITRTTPESSADLVIPLYFRYRSATTQARMITPLYFTKRSADSDLSLLLPLYFDRRTKDQELTLGLPCYGRYRSGPFTFATFFPLYYHSEDTELRSEFTYYFPVYGAYRRGETVSKHYVLFPLYSRIRDEELRLSAWDALWPLIHYETSPASTSVRLLPFYWHSRTPERAFTAGLPLYWSFSSGEDRFSLFAPVYAVSRKGDWYRRRFFLGPLYMDTTDARAGLSKQEALFWLYSRKVQADETRTWFIPLYYHRSGADAFRTLWLLPPYVHVKDPEKEWLHLWPLFGRTRNRSYTEYATLWPLFRYGSDPAQDRSMTQFLLYYRARSGQSSDTLLFPLWYHRASPVETIDSSLFLHWYEREAGRERTRFTLLWLVPGTDIAFIRYRRDAGQLRHGVFPLYSYYADGSSDAKRWTFLWPLFSYSSRGEFEQETGFLWKLISYERDDAETMDFRVLWRFIRRSTTRTTSNFELNPFYYFEAEEGKGSYWAILGGLIGVETTPEMKKRYRVFWVF